MILPEWPTFTAGFDHMSTLWAFHVLFAWHSRACEPAMANDCITIVCHASGQMKAVEKCSCRDSNPSQRDENPP